MVEDWRSHRPDERGSGCARTTWWLPVSRRANNVIQGDLMCESTDRGDWRPISPVERQLLAEALRANHLHLTEQREAVCESVFGCPGHICAEHVLASVVSRYPAREINKTTVYRALDLLVDLGLIRSHKSADGPAQYEAASRGRHGHLMCERCGRLAVLDEDLAALLREAPLARHGFAVDFERYPIRGLCAACRG